METQFRYAFHASGEKTFKSYYVVWKPDFMQQFKRLVKRFKSYYVVWKPFLLAYLSFRIIFCLNRTM